VTQRIVTQRAILFLPLMLVGALPAVASAQSGLDGRVGRLESEMRAVQRKVFPNGQLLQPDVTAPVAPTEVPGAPASSAVVDLTARVTSLEQQLATLTGQVEQNGYQIRTLREQFEAYRRSTDAKLTAPVAAAPVDGSDPAPIATAPASRPLGGSNAASGATRPAAAGPTVTDERAARLAALDRPSSGDAAEDAYLYGYRLWQAKLYPEAQAQLKKTVADFPKSKRASYAQNLLGRAYLDDGKPSLASMAFYDNYKKMPDGERAPDSLLYLGQALVKLNKPADACKVYDELSDVYAGKLSAAMQADITRGRTAAKCK
jgi:TolA-binding protein